MCHVKKLLTLFFVLFPVITAAQTCSTISANRFIVNNDETVTDTKAGLMWKKCSEEQSGKDCHNGNAVTYTWQSAMQHAQTLNKNGGFAGHSDWRVPNIKELLLIVEEQCIEPALNLTVFPNMPSNYFWSSSSETDSPDGAWFVNFSLGNDYTGYKDDYHHVRLVRQYTPET